ncbi:hypothetical protein CYLTODRAFT_457512 [Cylindrobasidium torrendii FP15055 ss-10]|uniref:Uncharacterized protein n=1 Tax=Cylindrobasidium torrendii FP15055 ss-10 TaxID=1314674 RepID=A0A0D7B1P3_9AGAR|nr:hypothetical protein CYLTODRAFT_457512 [Cylindrobasidium torrendii FP15055 ss-10]
MMLKKSPPLNCTTRCVDSISGKHGMRVWSTSFFDPTAYVPTPAMKQRVQRMSWCVSVEWEVPISSQESDDGLDGERNSGATRQDELGDHDLAESATSDEISSLASDEDKASTYSNSNMITVTLNAPRTRALTDANSPMELVRAVGEIQLGWLASYMAGLPPQHGGVNFQNMRILDTPADNNFDVKSMLAQLNKMKSGWEEKRHGPARDKDEDEIKVEENASKVDDALPKRDEDAEVESTQDTIPKPQSSAACDTQAGPFSLGRHTVFSNGISELAKQLDLPARRAILHVPEEKRAEFDALCRMVQLAAKVIGLDVL